jgi:hypothetical protein
MVTQNELKVVLKVSAQAGQSGVADKTSVESRAKDDDFQEEKRRRRHISNDTLPGAKNSTKPVPITTAVKPPPKAVLTYNFFAPLRTTDIDMESTGLQASDHPVRTQAQKQGNIHC